MKRFIILVLFLSVNFQLISQLNIYYTDQQDDGIFRLPLNGEEKELVIPNSNTSRGIHIDYEKGVLYFADGENHQIVKADLNGMNVQELTYVETPIDVYFDKGKQILYFSDNSSGSIYKMNADGSDKIQIATDFVDLAFLEVDEINDYLYFSTSNSDFSIIYRSDLDGQNIEILFEEDIKIVGIAIDAIQQYMYVGDRTNNVITKISIEDGSKKNIVSTSAFNYTLELDDINGVLYWGEKIEERIMRCDTEGKDKEVFFENVYQFGDLAMDLKNICQKYEIVYDTISVTDTLYIDVVFTNDYNVTVLKEIKLYPNPTKDYLTIEAGESYEDIEAYSLEIIDVNGSEIFRSNFESNIFTLNLDSEFMKPGMYFVQILDSTGKLLEIKKLILE